VLHGVLVTCRSGFEKEAAAELMAYASEQGLTGFIQAEPESGFCLFSFHTPTGEKALGLFDWKSLIFARSVFLVAQPLLQFTQDDRISPILNAIGAWPKALQTFSRFIVESSDAESGRELSAFCKSFAKPFKQACLKRGYKLELWDEAETHEASNERCLHVFFVDYTRAFVGLSILNCQSPWPRGIVRLRSPSDAPSRSTLKLEEAFLTFLNEDERASSLSPARRAIDLGACPGGWTYQFVRRGVRTTAVDNGAMDERLMTSGLVEHLRVDGFKFSPARPVDWMVCDMVEKPRRVADLVLRWWTEQAAKRMIFNLKLPMKKRWAECAEIRALMQESLLAQGRPFRLQFKHLYHDREEVTGYLGPHL